MIYVTQGHQKSIALEVFLKSFSLLTEKEQSKFTLVVNRETLLENLEICHFDYKVEEDLVHYSGSSIQCKFFEDTELPQTTTSLEIALDSINPKTDILLTLPTSKDQLILNGKNKAGYTEYLREYAATPDTSMLFASDLDHVLLVTDHIPVCCIASTINSEMIVGKISHAIEGMTKFFSPYQEVLIAGINPHVGENGILGDEDSVIYSAIEILKNKFPDVRFLGPFSGDTLHFHKSDKRQLRVFMYHDQGLPVFKDKNGAVGLNISLGLPFLRMSVDHGTAFELFGKNKADYLGSMYLLQKGLEAQRKLLGD